MKHMRQLQEEFRQQVRAIYRYLRMLQFVDRGASRLVNRSATEEWPIDVTTTHVLKASVYLHLYNLIEATVRAALVRVAQEIGQQGLTFGDLTEEWQRSWLKTIGKSTEPLNADSRLTNLFDVTTQVVSRATVAFEPHLASGNIDDRRIEKLLERHGMTLTLAQTLRVQIKRPVLDDLGPLGVVRRRRNELAHGLDTFEQCGKSVSVQDLTSWAIVATRYLRQVIAHCEAYIEAQGFKQAAGAS